MKSTQELTNDIFKSTFKKSCRPHKTPNVYGRFQERIYGYTRDEKEENEIKAIRLKHKMREEK